MKLKVGMKFKGWTVARIHKWPKWYDLELIKDGGIRGYKRIYKKGVK